MKIVLASNNAGKIQELKAFLDPLHIDLRAQAEFAIEEANETGLTFIENALIKARHASRLTGLPALADDSGLAVTALKGAPGIYSGRYAGAKADPKDNIHKLLTEMEGVPEENRETLF